MTWGIGFIPSYSQSGWHNGDRTLTDITSFMCDLSKPTIIIGGIEYYKGDDGSHHPAKPFMDTSPPQDEYDTLDARSTVYQSKKDAEKRIDFVMKQWWNFKSPYQYYDFDKGM